ncbi:unnamed protein product [Nesidiocoris tenuis]|uniref:Uncharacterized protein n=1 Tax=Nesidiocoris tenuis TaxID=355587 RepID=A0A6H5HGA9_9HEMI|nr:unnamed protein product [Nesidiocoris tenuis]
MANKDDGRTPCTSCSMKYSQLIKNFRSSNMVGISCLEVRFKVKWNEDETSSENPLERSRVKIHESNMHPRFTNPSTENPVYFQGGKVKTHLPQYSDALKAHFLKHIKFEEKLSKNPVETCDQSLLSGKERPSLTR